MNAAQLNEARSAEPFRPFRIRTADGSEYPVPHPEFMLLHPDKRTVIVVSPTNEGAFSVLDIRLITALVHEGDDQSEGAA